jgi:cytochrome c5
MTKRAIFVFLAAVVITFAYLAAAQERTATPHAASTAAADHASSAVGKSTAVHPDAAERLEGEKRFKANCGRCHTTPHKYSPRVMATIVRHMRVRATLTDEDMRLILHYMTQ